MVENQGGVSSQAGQKQLKLYISARTNFFAQLCLATALMAGVTLDVVVADEAVKAAKDFKQRNVTGQLPLLEDGDATIAETIAICKYIARVGPEGAYLLGNGPL